MPVKQRKVCKRKGKAEEKPMIHPISKDPPAPRAVWPKALRSILKNLYVMASSWSMESVSGGHISEQAFPRRKMKKRWY